ncbi:hypothetical protein [Candidatus Uabimicrobium amorphum]|uniref:Uncharacterized protein n=1 Tax=Uabimicrobium amorphum TaxID=2596890 RepID=A0A5S9F363_UABAM|nr:hypothetical protein [Candidatus Uabimicrobium amorphum]BBM83199.1 hypothetical protein UABAM_01550 [Candidatus Uabimicrobium amorphum]
MIILTKDLRFFSRDRYFYFKRAFLVIALSMLFCFYFFSATSYDGLGGQIIAKFSLLSFACFLITIPTIATDSIVQEQRQQTLALLSLSTISYSSILYEKFFALLAMFYAYYFGIIPLLFVCGCFGGIAPAQILQIVIVQLSFVMVINSIGLLVASFHASYQTQVLAFLVALLWLGTSMLIAIIPDIFAVSPFTTYICQSFSPFLVVEKILATSSWSLTLTNLAIETILTVIFLHMAAKLLRSHILIFNEPQTIKKSKMNTKHDNPIFWRDYYKVYGGNRSFLVRFFLTLFAIPLATYLSHFLFMYLYARPVPFNLLSFTTTGLIITIPCTIFTLFSGCTRSFVRETRRKSFDFLRLTSLSNRQIILGKSRAILFYSAPFIILMIIFSAIFIYFFPKYTQGKWLYITMSVTNLLAIFSCAFCLSSRVKTSGAAAIYTYIIFTILHGATSLVSNFIASSPAANVKIMATYYTLITIGYIIIAILFFEWTNKNLRT